MISAPTSPYTAATRTPMPPIEQVVTQLVLSDGNLHLAAERLTGSAERASDVLNALAADPTAYEVLVRQLKVKAVIGAYRDMTALQASIVATIETFEPRDMVSAFRALAEIFRDASTLAPQGAGFGAGLGAGAIGSAFNSTTNINFNSIDKVLQVLPPDVQRAVRTLIDQPQGTPPPLPPPSTAISDAAGDRYVRPAATPRPAGAEGSHSGARATDPLDLEHTFEGTPSRDIDDDGIV